MKKISKEQLLDYFILVARVCLAYTLINYGWGKLTGDQFGVSDEMLKQPLQGVDLFHLSWYAAGHEPFRSFIGVSQIVAGLLFLYNRTLLLGAFMSIPIWLNILIWDITFMGLITAFTFRLTFYLLLTFLILWYYRERVVNALRTITRGAFVGFRYPLWAYLLLPILAFILDLLGVIPNSIIHLVTR